MFGFRREAESDDARPTQPMPAGAQRRAHGRSTLPAIAIRWISLVP